MLQRIILIAATLAWYGGVSAQSLPPAQQEPTWVMVDDHIVGELVLDTAQRRVLLNVEDRYQQDYDVLLQQEDTMSEEAFAQAVHQLNARRQAEIRQILTPEQRERWLFLTEAERRKGDENSLQP